MEQKRKGKTSTVWRPLSTQASSAKEDEDPTRYVNLASGSGAFSGNKVAGALESGPVPFNNKVSISFKVGAFLMRFVKGKWGSTQQKIEEETGVKIIFPPARDEDYIVIEGSSDDSITRASERIQKIVDEAVNSPYLGYSHFISLPLAINRELVKKLVNFKSSILETKRLLEDKGHANYTRIEESIFIKPATFHLTVLMLKLWNKDRIAAAAEVLQNVASKVNGALDNRPVSVRLKGLEIMKGSLEKACVLYAPVEEIGSENRLQHACQIIIDAFVEAGLVFEKDTRSTLKLHATVMNVRHRERTGYGDSFDARDIFKKYGSEEWGEYLIPEAHLSQMFISDENGYYHRCSSISFPKGTQID